MLSQLFRWREGNGWLVLAGKGNLSDPLGSNPMLDILSQVLLRTVDYGPLAYIWAAGDEEQADRDLEAIADLGGRTGYLLDIITEDDETLQKQLAEAGIIILGDGEYPHKLHSALAGVVIEAIDKAYQRGATIFGVGTGATVFGHSWLLDNKIQEGFHWLENAFILTGDVSSQEEQTKHQFLSSHPDTYSMWLKDGAGLAFSPTGAVEVWGNKQITISLPQQPTNQLQ
jgi:hypothetical protein